MLNTPITTSQVRVQVQRFLSALTEYKNLRNAAINEDRERVVKEIRVESRKEVKNMLLLSLISVGTMAIKRVQTSAANHISAADEALMLSSMFSLVSASVSMAVSPMSKYCCHESFFRSEQRTGLFALFMSVPAMLRVGAVTSLLIAYLILLLSSYVIAVILFFVFLGILLCIVVTLTFVLTTL
ncbi:hypothetical protein Hypma_011138 [Hypsizygus marmoreus]|uniref:Uncharacterized protein n=1 Tax=Hypsizygus marmoreus TaxID=39966 RepID=A0A369JKQ0_HYPMA|nr:hypothetical protein Hypma_011138 [Hypsizygus marmoreus]